MPNTFHPQNSAAGPAVYEIRMQGHLDEQWTEWFGGMSVTREADGQTLLAGPVVDQAALHGLLRRIRDLGMPLISVIRVVPGRVDRDDGVDPFSEID